MRAQEFIGEPWASRLGPRDQTPSPYLSTYSSGPSQADSFTRSLRPPCRASPCPAAPLPSSTPCPAHSTTVPVVPAWGDDSYPSHQSHSADDEHVLGALPCNISQSSPMASLCLLTHRPNLHPLPGAISSQRLFSGWSFDSVSPALMLPVTADNPRDGSLHKLLPIPQQPARLLRDFSVAGRPLQDQLSEKNSSPYKPENLSSNPDSCKSFSGIHEHHGAHTYNAHVV